MRSQPEVCQIIGQILNHEHNFLDYTIKTMYLVNVNKPKFQYF